MKRLNFIILALVGIYLLSGLILFLLQERFIFLDEELPQGYRFNFETPFEEVRLSTRDGGTLHGLHFKIDSPKGVIIYYHGNAGNLVRWGKAVQYHVGLGYDVIVMDYRGYGKSIGKRTQENLLADAQQFYDYGLGHYAEDRITLYGRSLGTGLATYMASKNHPRNLILETPYHDFKSVAQRYYPIFPVGLAMRFNFKSNEYIQSVDCPIYIFHGTEDDIVPYRFGKKLYESIPTDKAELITIEGGGHKNLIEFEEFKQALRKVLK